MSNELITLIANIALTVSVIVAVIFGIAQLKNAGKDRRERITLDTLRALQTREFAEMLQYIHNNKIPSSNEEWLNWPKDDQVRFIRFSQQMESLGLLLAGRLISVDLLEKTLGSFVCLTWEKCAPLVLDMREKFNDPYMSEYFQRMANQIGFRMKNRPRKPFHLSSGIAV